MLLKNKKTAIKHFDATEIIGGEEGIFKKDSQEYKIESKGIPEYTKSCSSEGSWITVDIETFYIYRVLISSIIGDI